MHWLMLILAGIFEVTWAIAMKYSDGFSVVVPSIITVVGYIASAVFLSLALKELPLGTAYAMWTGFGIVGTSVLGISQPLSQHSDFPLLRSSPGATHLKSS